MVDTMRMEFFFMVVVLIIEITVVTCRSFVLDECDCRLDGDCDSQDIRACEWGSFRDHCGKLVCAKGPGERCAGPRNRFGECGEGLYCKRMDERCHGCSTQNDIICYP